MRYIEIKSDSGNQYLYDLIQKMVSNAKTQFDKKFISTKFKDYLEKEYDQQFNLLNNATPKTLQDLKNNVQKYLEVVNVLYERTNKDKAHINIEKLLQEAERRLKIKKAPATTRPSELDWVELSNKAKKQEMFRAFGISINGENDERISNSKLFVPKSLSPLIMLRIKNYNVTNIFGKFNKLPTDSVRIADFINHIKGFLRTRKGKLTVDNKDLVKMGYYFIDYKIVPINQVTNMEGFTLNLSNNHVVTDLADGLKVDFLQVNARSALKSFPENMEVISISGLDESDLKLPNNLKINYLDLSRTSIETLPENLTAGTLILNKYIKEIPSSLKVTFKFDISESIFVVHDIKNNINRDTQTVDDESKYR